MLSELPVLDHVGYHELFDSDHLVFVDQLARELMLEVVAAVSYAFVELGYLDTGFGTVAATFPFSGKRLLSALELFLSSCEVFGVGDLFTRGECRKVFDPQIDADFALTRGLGWLELADE